MTTQPTTPRPVFARTIPPTPRPDARRDDPDYDYDRRCSGCGRVPECCECADVDARRDRERWGGI
jgi:hypothetical protein